MRRIAFLLAVATAVASPATAGTIEKALMKLDPEERARQICAIRAVDQLRRDKQLPNADRVQASTSNPAAFDGHVVKATSGAVRAKDRWYSLNFTCGVTEDGMKAVSFAYKLGSEIPEEQWEDLGLWR